MSANRFRLIGTKEQIEARRAELEENRKREFAARQEGFSKALGKERTVVEYRVAYENEHGATHHRKFKTLEAAQSVGKALGPRSYNKREIDLHNSHSRYGSSIGDCWQCNYRYDLRLLVRKCKLIRIECRFLTEWESIEG